MNGIEKCPDCGTDMKDKERIDDEVDGFPIWWILWECPKCGRTVKK